MLKSMLKIAAATVLFAGVHSVLASKAAKKRAGRLLGERGRNGLYRPLYNALAIATLGGLAIYGFRLPDRDLYRVTGLPAVLMRSVQLLFLLYLLHAVRQIGILKFAGLPNIVALATGQPFVPAEPEGQGPIAESGLRMKVAGPFRHSRHPLNFGMVPIIWLMPHMTRNFAAFGTVTTLYLIIGSLHEESRLKDAYGQAYADYQDSGINFFIPVFSTTRNLKS